MRGGGIEEEERGGGRRAGGGGGHARGAAGAAKPPKRASVAGGCIAPRTRLVPGIGIDSTGHPSAPLQFHGTTAGRFSSKGSDASAAYLPALEPVNGPQKVSKN